MLLCGVAYFCICKKKSDGQFWCVPRADFKMQDTNVMILRTYPL